MTKKFAQTSRRISFRYSKKAMSFKELVVYANCDLRLKVKVKAEAFMFVMWNFVIYESIYLITAYPKSEKDNQSKSNRNSIAKVIKALENALSEKE